MKTKKMKTVTVPAQKARRHRDCAYCGCGWDDGRICGVCKEQGIDGQVIPGTSAKKAYERKVVR